MGLLAKQSGIVLNAISNTFARIHGEGRDPTGREVGEELSQ